MTCSKKRRWSGSVGLSCHWQLISVDTFAVGRINTRNETSAGEESEIVLKYTLQLCGRQREDSVSFMLYQKNDGRR